MNAGKNAKLLAEAIEWHRAGRVAEARARYERILADEPRNFDANHLAGVAALQEGRPGVAVAWLERAHALKPGDRVCAMRLALAYSTAGRNEEAEARLLKVVGSHPTWAEAWTNLGSVQQRRGRMDDALASFRRAVAEKADYAAGWSNLGLALLFVDRPDEALECHDRALKVDPRLGPALRGRAMALQHLHRVPEAARAYQATIQAAPGDFEARSYRLVALQYLDDISREQLYREHRAFGAAVRREPPSARPSRPEAEGDAERRLRVAFLSPDLRLHSVAYFIEPLLRHLDRGRFEIVLYHDHVHADATSERLRSLATLWRNFAGQPNAAVAAQIRADAPDILVDLAGHSGLNRLPLLAERLAPMQITYLGYPDTTGIDAMDYRLVDAITDPPGQAEALASEELVRFAPTAWAYAPPEPAPEPRPRAGPGVIFGSCNNLAKVSDATLRAWGVVLREIPESRLRLKAAGLNREGTRTWLAGRLQAAGIDPARIEVSGWTSTVEQHLGFYHGIDVALDTFPYNGTTTTCEALWMGMPVVTRLGDRHCARVGASLLTAVGCPEWIGASAEEYVRIAVELGRAAERRADLRRTLRPRMAASALLDHAGQAERFGAALRGCWERRPAAAKSTAA